MQNQYRLGGLVPQKAAYHNLLSNQIHVDLLARQFFFDPHSYQ